MTNKCASSSAATRTQADRIIDRLKKANFPAGDISIQFPDRETFKNKKPVEKKPGKVSFGLIIGMLTGGVMGLVVGWLAGTGILKIPGADSLATSGPIIGALFGTVLGALLGGIGAWLIILTLPDDGSNYSHGNVVAGNIIVTVRTDDTERFVRAKNVFTMPANDANPPEPWK